MRYVAKIHVLDVMDQVVVSGYVYDADVLTDPDHLATEFTYSAPGIGLSEPLAWLLNSLYRCLVHEQTPAQSRESRGLQMGGPHIISGSSDIARDLMG